MNDTFTLLMSSLLRCTLILSLAAVLVRGLLWAVKTRSPRVHRVAVCLVLLQSWMLAQWSFQIACDFAPAQQQKRALAGASELDHLPAPPLADPLPAEQTLTVSATPGKAFSWPLVVTLVWLAGMVAVVLWQAISYLRFTRSLPPSLPVKEVWLLQWQAIQERSGVKRPIAFHATEALGPMLCRAPSGYRLLVPRSLWVRLSNVQRSAILRHELAHYQRADVWKSLAVRLLALPQWFNPLAWWMVRHFDRCAEWACDGEVCRSLTRVTDYASALLLLGAQGSSGKSFSPAAGGRGLAFRIRRLLTPNMNEDSRMKKLLIITAAVTLLGLGLARFELVADEPATTDVEAIGSDSAPRVANRVDPHPSELPRYREAIVDVSYVFKHLSSFQRQLSEMKANVAKAEGLIKQQTQELRSLKNKIDALAPNSQERQSLMAEYYQQNAELQARMKISKDALMRQEAKCYQLTFLKVTDEIAQYAKEHDIRVVRRSKHLSYPVVADIDVSDHRAVLQSINREVLYWDRSEFDITHQIIERLNLADGDES